MFDFLQCSFWIQQSNMPLIEEITSEPIPEPQRESSNSSSVKIEVVDNSPKQSENGKKPDPKFLPFIKRLLSNCLRKKCKGIGNGHERSQIFL